MSYPRAGETLLERERDGTAAHAPVDGLLELCVVHLGLARLAQGAHVPVAVLDQALEVRDGHLGHGFCGKHMLGAKHVDVPDYVIPTEG